MPTMSNKCWITAILAGSVACAQSAFAQSAGPNKPTDANVSEPAVSGTLTGTIEADAVDGNKARAGLYVRRLAGPRLEAEAVRLRDSKGFDRLDIWAHDFGGQAESAQVALWNRAIPARLRLRFDRGSFYNDPLLATAVGSNHSRLGTDLTVRPTPWALVRGGYRSESESLGVNSRGENINYDIVEANYALDVRLGHGSLGGSFSSLDFRDRVPGAVSTNTTQYGLNYDLLCGRRFSLAANTRWADVRQANLKSSVFTAGVDGQYWASNHVWIDGRWRYRDIGLAPTLNGYVTKSSIAGGGLGWRIGRGLTVRAGGSSGEVQRLNAVQKAVDKPTETRYFARMDYRGAHSLRWGVSYAKRQLTDLRDSAAPSLGDSSELFYSSEQKADAKISREIGKGGLVYVFGQWRQWQNKLRKVDNELAMTGAGLSLPIGRKVTVAGDVFYRNTTSTYSALAGMIPSSWVGHGGLGWTITPTCRVSGDYYHVGTAGGDYDRSDYVTASVAWNLRNGGNLSLGYHREGYDNAAFSRLKYDADVVRVSYGAPF